MHTLYSCTKIFSCFFFLFNKLFFYYNFLKKLKNFFVKPKTNTDRIINVTGFHVRVLSLIHWTTVFRADNMHGAIICDNDAFFWNSSWATWQRLFSRFPSFQKYVHSDLLGFFFIHHRFACEQMYGEKKKKKETGQKWSHFCWDTVTKPKFSNWPNCSVSFSQTWDFKSFGLKFPHQL